MKRQTFKMREVKIDIIPFSDALGVGYIRFEKRGEYLCSIDSNDRITQLKKLRSAIDNMIKQKELPK